ncbi:MAG: glycosyl hydrolase [Bacteroidia bacterium]|nr:glycosyl hydrolase [Bacteroidia bacterium]
MPCALSLVLLVSCNQSTTEIYSSSKPLTRWWWFASEIKKQDVAGQLDWLKANGFGGVEVAWLYPLNRMKKDTVNITPRLEWLGEEWTDVVKYCKKYGDSIGLSVDFTYGSLWPFGDLQVKPEESTQSFNNPDFRQWITASWDYPKKGLVLDHLNKRAFEHYAARMGKALEPAMQAGKPSGIFVDSWEVDTKNLWTIGFDSVFKALYGYDIVPYMENDILSPDFKGQRYDYMKLISSLVINNFYIPFSDEAHRLGGFSRGQCSGSPTDLISAYATLDVPESEAMLYEPSYSRIAASAAALSGRNRVTSETFTCLYGWPREHMREEKVTDLKIVADALFAHGTNQIIWHGTPYNTKGSDSISFYATVHVGPAGALSKHLHSFNNYLTSVSDYMRTGDVYSDVAIYLPLEDSWIAGEMPKEKQLPWAWGEYEFRYQVVPEEIRGYQPMWINGEYLKKGSRLKAQGASKAQGARLKDQVRIKDQGLSIKVGRCNFKSLYVDAKYLDYEVLKTMTELALEGFPICLKQKPEEAAYFQHADFEALATRLVELSSADWSKVAVSKPLIEGADLPFFWCRQEKNKYYIFFAHPIAKEFRYPVKYGQADTQETLIRSIKINFEGRSLEVNLAFKPYQSLLLEISSNGKYRFVRLPSIL